MESYLKGGLGGVHCTLYIVQCTSYSVQCTVKSIQCTGGLGGQSEEALEEDTSFSGNKLLLDL